MTVTVRAASPDEAARLHGLMQDHAAFERGAAPVTIAALRAILTAQPSPVRVLVAESRTILVGYAALAFDWSLWRGQRHGHLDCLFVAEGHRGGGVGAKLLDAVLRKAAEEGMERVEWQTPDWNHDAMRFYSRAGAQAVGKIRFTQLIGLSD